MVRERAVVDHLAHQLDPEPAAAMLRAGRRRRRGTRRRRRRSQRDRSRSARRFGTGRRRAPPRGRAAPARRAAVPSPSTPPATGIGGPRRGRSAPGSSSRSYPSPSSRLMPTASAAGTRRAPRTTRSRRRAPRAAPARRGALRAPPRAASRAAARSPPSPSSESDSAARVHASRQTAPPARAREADERAGGAALDAAREVRQVARQPQQLQLERRARADRAPGAPAPATARRRAGRGTAQRLERPRFASGSPNSRSIASAPMSPTRAGTPPRAPHDATGQGSTPVTVCSSPAPLVEHSSTCDSGSRRAPKRDFVRRTPFAIAPIRPRSRRVHVEDPVGLRESERPEHDRLRLVASAPPLAASLEPCPEETVPRAHPRRPVLRFNRW